MGRKVLFLTHSLFGDRETVLAQQAGPVPEFCLNHTRIGLRRGATRARMIVVRQVGGRSVSLAVSRTVYVTLQPWPADRPGPRRYRVTQ